MIDFKKIMNFFGINKNPAVSGEVNDKSRNNPIDCELVPIISISNPNSLSRVAEFSQGRGPAGRSASDVEPAFGKRFQLGKDADAISEKGQNLTKDNVGTGTDHPGPTADILYQENKVSENQSQRSVADVG